MGGVRVGATWETTSEELRSRLWSVQPRAFCPLPDESSPLWDPSQAWKSLKTGQTSAGLEFGFEYSLK